jgi:hypothetical protein
MNMSAVLGEEGPGVLVSEVMVVRKLFWEEDGRWMIEGCGILYRICRRGDQRRFPRFLFLCSWTLSRVGWWCMLCL